MQEVRVDLKYVKNLGNYETVHIGIGVSDSVRKDESDEEAFNRVYDFVEGKLAEKLEEQN